MTTTKLLIAAAVLVLAGCSEPADEPTVASLPETSAPADAGVRTESEAPGTRESEEPEAERPVLRVDDTEQRRKALWNAYNTCLLDNGAKRPTGDGPVIALGDVMVVYPGPKKAQEACLHLEPVQPPALEAATNPDFQDDAQRYVECLREGGLWVERLNSENLDWTYAEGHPVPDDSAETEQRCLVEVFGDA